MTAWIRRNESKVIRLGQDLARPALTVGQGAASLLAALATVFVLVVPLLLEGPALMRGMLNVMSPAHFLTSLIAGVVVLATLAILRVPFPFLSALWVALVDLLPMVGGALAGIPTVLFAVAHSLTAGIVTAAVFVIYTQIENHVLNPIVMGKTVRISPLFVLVSVLVGASIGGWLGGKRPAAGKTTHWPVALTSPFLWRALAQDKPQLWPASTLGADAGTEAKGDVGADAGADAQARRYVTTDHGPDSRAER